MFSREVLRTDTPDEAIVSTFGTTVGQFDRSDEGTLGQEM